MSAANPVGTNAHHNGCNAVLSEGNHPVLRETENQHVYQQEENPGQNA
jgi:hypothetical protein